MKRRADAHSKPTHLVIGAGSAGAILAARLCERPDYQVQLLEAGPDYPDRASTPEDLLDSRDLGGRNHDWAYRATTLPGRSDAYPRAKVVGGTSAINAAVAMWPRPADLDAWQALGNSAWPYSLAARYLARLECDPDGSAVHHGRKGAVPIERYRDAELVPLQRAFRSACVASGMAQIDDHNAPGSGGVGPWPMNRAGTTRMSTLLAYLNPARMYRNLKVCADRTVDRLLIEGDQVRGVRLLDGSSVLADSVLLSAGAIGSPAILMRSGLGPAEELGPLGIQPRLDLPGVGARLWDHPGVPILLVPLPGECVIGRDPRFQIMASLTAPGSAEDGDLQLVMATHRSLADEPGRIEMAGVAVVAALWVVLMVPKGHGRLSLRSRDASVQPDIDLAFCAHPEDERRLMAGVRMAWSLLHQAPLLEAYQRILGLTQDMIASDQQLRAYVRASVDGFCHASGTVPMGPAHDRHAVLDQGCRLRGLHGLRVADASAFPAIPRVAPNFTVMMLAERIAERMLRKA